MHEKGIGAEAYYPYPSPNAIHKENFGAFNLPETEIAAKQVISLPIHPSVTDEQIDIIAETSLKSLNINRIYKMKTAIKGKAGTQFMNRNEDYRQGFRFSESQRWKAATKASKVYPFIDRFSKNDYVLDIGCGVGIELNITSTKADFSVGTDIDVKNLITARSFLKQKSKIDFVRADIHFLPFKDEAFSKILCFDVIEHLRFPDRAVKEISRIVKTDGEGYIRLPNKWTVHEGLLRILALSKPSKGLWNVRHVSFFSLKE
jgi:SAM-dependent methyltransferase